MGTTPSFVSGARIFIKVNGKTEVFGVASNISTSATVVKPNVLGQYGPAFIQKLQQGPVQGSFTILKVLNKTSRDNRKSVAQTSTDIQNGSLSPKTLGASASASVKSHTVNGNPYNPLDSTLRESLNNSPFTEMFVDHMDPARVLLSTSQDIEIYHRYPTADGKFQDALLFKVSNCRITSRSTSISSGSLVNESFNFTGLLLDDGSGTFSLDSSGF